jgi:GH24 family phage-related lysozyme (muramidase)
VDYVNAQDMLKEYEGNVKYMYLDAHGKVTVGVGQMIPSEFDAAGYPFYLINKPVDANPFTEPPPPKKATEEQIVQKREAAPGRTEVRVLRKVHDDGTAADGYRQATASANQGM